MYTRRHYGYYSTSSEVLLWLWDGMVALHFDDKCLSEKNSSP